MSSLLKYIPCEAKDEQCLVYVTKLQPAPILVQSAFGKTWYRHVSLMCGWDNGENDGRALNALVGPAKRCKKLYIIADLSWRGLLTASRAMKLCRRGRAACIGINDDWLAVADQAWGSEAYRIPTNAEDLRIRLTAAQRAAILRQLGIGPSSRSILAGGQEVHLEAFCHKPTAKALKSLLRSKV